MTVSAAGRVIFSAGPPPGEPSTESLWTAAPDGVVTRQTTQAAGELAHLAPQLVDGDRALLLTVRRTGKGRDQMVGQVLASGARTVLVDDAADGRYDASSGQPRFMRRWQLVAAPPRRRSCRDGASAVDASRRHGPLSPEPCYAVSRDGEHFYADGSPIESQTPVGDEVREAARRCCASTRCAPPTRCSLPRPSSRPSAGPRHSHLRLDERLRAAAQRQGAPLVGL